VLVLDTVQVPKGPRDVNFRAYNKVQIFISLSRQNNNGARTRNIINLSGSHSTKSECGVTHFSELIRSRWINTGSSSARERYGVPSQHAVLCIKASKKLLIRKFSYHLRFSVLVPDIPTGVSCFFSALEKKKPEQFLKRGQRLCVKMFTNSAFTYKQFNII